MLKYSKSTSTLEDKLQKKKNIISENIVRTKLNLKFCISVTKKKCVNISDLARAVDLINMNKKSSYFKSMLIKVVI